MMNLQAYYKVRDSPMDGVSLFQSKYPSTKRGRRPVGASGGSKEPRPVYESPVHEPDFCWELNRSALRSAMASASQAAFGLAAANKHLPLMKQCAGECGKSYPKGSYLNGTMSRITTLWGKNEWKKASGMGRCALCTSDVLMAKWRVFTSQGNHIPGADSDVGTQVHVPFRLFCSFYLLTPSSRTHSHLTPSFSLPQPVGTHCERWLS